MRILLLLALAATPAHAADPWTGRLAAVGDAVSRAPRFGAWLDDVARLADAAVAEPAGRPLVEQARAVARGPLAFDPFSRAEWAARGVRVDGPAWFEQRGGRVVASVVRADAAAPLAPEATPAKVGALDVRRLPGLLLAERDGYLVTAADEETLTRLLGAPAATPDESLCAPGDADLVVLGAAPGATVAQGVAGCATIRVDEKQAALEARANGVVAAGVAVLLSREAPTSAAPLSTDGAAGVLRVRLAPAAIGLLKAALVRRGLHRHEAVRALGDQFTGEALVVVDGDGGLRAALRVRDPAALRGLTAAPLEAGLRLAARVHDDFVLLSTGEPRPQTGPGPVAPALLLDARPAALQALPGLEAWAAALKRFARVTLSVDAGEVLTVKAALSGI
jgi:hypothetical protein